MSSRYADLYLTESRDHLNAANAALLELERSPNATGPLEALFRAVHTVKGMSGVMGFGPVGELSHQMESVLAAIRDGATRLDADTLAVLFDATDALERAIAASVTGSDATPWTNEVLARLRGLVGACAPASSAAGLPRQSLPESMAAEALDVDVCLLADTSLPGARALLVLQRARSLGDIVAVAPPETAFLEPGFAGTFSFRLTTEARDADVERSVRAAGHVDRVALRRRSSPREVATPEASARGVDAWDAGHAHAPLERFVRIDLRRLDAMMNLAGELVIARSRLAQLASPYRDAELQDTMDQASRLIGDLQASILSTRMVPVWQVFDRFPRMVRDAARDAGREVVFEIVGREIELDRSLLEQIGDPIVHLLRNAVGHGLESPEERVAAGKPPAGRLILSAVRESSAVVIRVVDDGRGVDRAAVLMRAKAMNLVDADRETLSDDELLRHIARPGFSTAREVSALSGRGVGIDAVITRVRALGGALELRTRSGEGTTVSLRLPVTLAVIPALLALVGPETYALPLTHIRETIKLREDVCSTVRGRRVLLLRDEVLTLRALREVVGLPARDEAGGQVVVLEGAERRTGLIVDQILGQQEIVVKPFDPVRGASACFSGATILADGRPALIVEVSSLI
ncbi:MAG: Chemotaxis protein CheA [Gemmatimonadaceae bacterium]|nr:Chemotaxis protein CheA [Gemmatimonadaceae bacterium]